MNEINSIGHKQAKNILVEFKKMKNAIFLMIKIVIKIGQIWLFFHNSERFLSDPNKDEYINRFILMCSIIINALNWFWFKIACTVSNNLRKAVCLSYVFRHRVKCYYIIKLLLIFMILLTYFSYQSLLFIIWFWNMLKNSLITFIIVLSIFI